MLKIPVQIKAVSDELASYITPSGARLRAVPGKSETRGRCTVSPVSLSAVLAFVARACRLQKRNESPPNCNLKVALSVCNNMIFSIENSIDSAKKFYQKSVNMVKLEDTRSTYRNQLQAYTLTMNCLNNKERKPCHSQ